MNLINKQFKTNDNNIITYYETDNNKPILLIIHAQGTNATSYLKVIKDLSKNFHLFLVDCYGHGKSSHNREKYNLVVQGNDLIEFIQTIANGDVSILGHSSGGLIACYIASNYNSCKNLILEDAPLFSSNGDKRFNTFNFKDLSTVCHNFINQNEETDFVYYYFMNQYCWNFFPEDSREKIKNKLGEFALKYRQKHPEKILKVPFWPKKFLEVFNGLNEYDPYFGETFYDDSFNDNVNYNELLSNIKCNTLFMKANTTIGKDGLIQGALTDEDLEQVIKLISNIKVEYFDCGHGIHSEKPKEFINCVNRALEKQEFEQGFEK